MASLVFDSFECRVESDEAGCDSPYFVVFLADPQNYRSGRVRRIRRSSWDNEISSGSQRSGPVVVDDDVRADTVVLAALVEEDVDPDFSDRDEALEHVMGVALLDLMLGTTLLAGHLLWPEHFLKQTNDPDVLAKYLKRAFRYFLESYATNDDLVQVRRLRLDGAKLRLTFHGDGAEYAAQFSMQ